MIKNLIELGKTVNVTPFSERVNQNADVINIDIDLNNNDDFVIDKVNLSNADNQNIFYVKTTKTINPGKNVHFYPTDFKLVPSQIKSGKKINFDKVHRNFNNTKDFYQNLDIDEKVKQFLENFYSFLLKNNSQFLKKTYKENKNFIKDLTKREIENVIFVFRFSKDIINKYDISTENERKYYNIGDLKEIIDLFISFIPLEGSEKVNDQASRCSFCDNTDNLFSPNLATFYYSFTFDQKSAFYGLNGENISKQLIICNDCLTNLSKGKKYMQSYLQNSILGLNYFSLFDVVGKGKNLSKFLNYVKTKEISQIYTNKNMEEKRANLEESNRFLMDIGTVGKGSDVAVDLFFYEYDNGYRLIKLIKDIHPSRILDLLIENENVGSFSFNIYLINLFSSNNDEDYDLIAKERISLFEKILLEIPINYDSLTERFIQKVVYDLRNQEKDEFKASNLTQNHIRFLEFLSRLDCELYSNEIEPFSEKEGVCIDMIEPEEKIEGESGLEKMENFISKNEFFSDTPEIRAGIPLGVTIARLSYNINNYEKRMLGYANKRINDIDSLKKYTNEIQEKAVMHGIANQPIVSSFFEKVGKIFDKDNFSKDNFIFGMFIGYSLANKFTNPKKEGEKDD